MIGEGLRLMMVGMTTVFAFLLLLIVSIRLSAHVLGRLSAYFPDAPKASPKERVQDDAEIAVALAVAEAWRRNHGG